MTPVKIHQLQDASGDEAQRDAFVLPLDHRVQRDGRADAGQGDDHLEEAAHEHASVGAGAEDPAPAVLHGAVEGEGGDRDEGDRVEERPRRAQSSSVGSSGFCPLLSFARWWPLLVSFVSVSYRGSVVGTSGWSVST